METDEADRHREAKRVRGGGLPGEAGVVDGQGPVRVGGAAGEGGRDRGGAGEGGGGGTGYYSTATTRSLTTPPLHSSS